MSTYQYYDFYSIDRSLTKKEMETISTYSSRVDLSSRRAMFMYNYGDFRYNEIEVLNDFFDIMLYVANWGSRRLMMKFPSSMVSYQELTEYAIEAGNEFYQEINVLKKGSNVLIDMNLSNEDSEWIDAEGMLDEMLPIRNQILNGDYRALYLGWLQLASDDIDIPPDLPEPTLPANLKRLGYSLEKFVDFWEIHPDLIQAAAATSEEEEVMSDEGLISQINHLSDEEKNEILAELVNHEVKAQQQLRQRLAQLYKGPTVPKKKEPRTLGEIMQRTSKQAQIREEADTLARKQALLKKMKKIEEEESTMWAEVTEQAQQKTAKGYERAAELLLELKEYHEYRMSQAVFNSKFELIRAEYGKSVAFRRRMEKKRLL